MHYPDARNTFVCFDCETTVTSDGSVPDLVCVAFSKVVDGKITSILYGDTDDSKDQGLSVFLYFLNDPTAIIVGHTLTFDIQVMVKYAAFRGLHILPLVIAAYDAGRMYDIRMAEKLHAIAIGSLGKDPATGEVMRNAKGKESDYSLEWCVRLRLGRKDAKINDIYRLRYGEFNGVPIPQWPIEARQYPCDDTNNTLECALAQVGQWESYAAHEIEDMRCIRCYAIPAEIPYGSDQSLCRAHHPIRNLHDLRYQVDKDLALDTGAKVGLTVDPVMMAAVMAEGAEIDANGTLTERGREAVRFRNIGIVRADGSENQSLVKRLTAKAYGASASCPECNGKGRIPVTYSKRDPTKVTKDRACKACDSSGFNLTGVQVPRTEKGGIGIGRDPLSESDDPVLVDYSHFCERDKVESTYLPFLRRGLGPFGDPKPLRLSPNALVETGRTSYRDPTQTFPRSGKLRQCVVSGDGWLLSSVDYQNGELVTHGQSCLWLVGQSELARALNAGIKPHNDFGAFIARMPYAEFNARLDAGDKRCGDLRQAAKPPNFGFPGRMGAAKLVIQQRASGPDTIDPNGPSILAGGKCGYKGLRFCRLLNAAATCGAVKVTEWKRRTIPPTCKVCIEMAQFLREEWLRKYPENSLYFDLIGEMEQNGIPMIQHVSRRVRYTSEGNAIANGFFQSLLADAAKAALWQVFKECMIDHGTALFGSRVISFQHDELVTKHPADIAHVAAPRVAEIMTGKLREFCPDLAPACFAEAALMDRLYKGAKPVKDSTGKLIPWSPAS